MRGKGHMKAKVALLALASHIAKRFTMHNQVDPLLLCLLQVPLQVPAVSSDLSSLGVDLLKVVIIHMGKGISY